MTNTIMAPYWDRERRTCIQVERTDTYVKYIPLNISEGLKVIKTRISEFDQRYKIMVNYPVVKACQLYISYSRNIGATKEALKCLGKFVNITEKEIDMVTSKQTASEKILSKKEVSPKKEAPKKEAPKKEAPKKEAPKKEAPKKEAPKKISEKKGSASQMFKDLIMQGKLTDDEIFKEVQAEFGLDEKKKGYVGWYRNDLKKQGANPPEPKKGAKNG